MEWLIFVVWDELGNVYRFDVIEHIRSLHLLIMGLVP